MHHSFTAIKQKQLALSFNLKLLSKVNLLNANKRKIFSRFLIVLPSVSKNQYDRVSNDQVRSYTI